MFLFISIKIVVTFAIERCIDKHVDPVSFYFSSLNSS